MYYNPSLRAGGFMEKLIGFFILFLSVSVFAGELTTENLIGRYRLTHPMMRNQHIELDVNADRTFSVIVVKDGQPNSPCVGPFDLGLFREAADKEEVQTVGGTCTKEDTTAEILVYLKGVKLTSLEKGVYVTLDLKMDGKTMSGVMVKIKRQQ
jgi:hypothetical protein